jgi:hypothetical protein
MNRRGFCKTSENGNHLRNKPPNDTALEPSISTPSAANSIWKPLQYTDTKSRSRSVERLMKTHTSTKSSACVFTGFLVAVFSATIAEADLVQVPDTPFTNAGESTSSPFSAGHPIFHQQIYSASAFPHGGTIDKIKFRNDNRWGRIYGPTDIELQVAIAYTATTVANPIGWFALNIGDDFTVVLDGTITESYDGTEPEGSFDFVLDVANRFTYDPSKGNLLVQIIVLGPDDGFTRFDAAGPYEQDVTTTIQRHYDWAYPVGSIGQRNRPFGLVTQFEFVPEPSAFALFGIALLSLCASRRVMLCRSLTNAKKYCRVARM